MTQKSFVELSAEILILRIDDQKLFRRQDPKTFSSVTDAAAK
jgi:hypothetical protein